MPASTSKPPVAATNEHVFACRCVRRISVTLRNACELATEWADVIELRLDCLERASRRTSRACKSFSRPVILTFRPTEQGGHRDSTRAERKASGHHSRRKSSQTGGTWKAIWSMSFLSIGRASSFLITTSPEFQTISNRSTSDSPAHLPRGEDCGPGYRHHRLSSCFSSAGSCAS